MLARDSSLDRKPRGRSKANLAGASECVGHSCPTKACGTIVFAWAKEMTKLPSSYVRILTQTAITDEERQWVDEGFRRLEKLLGRRRMMEARIILPTPEYFPDPYEKSPACVELLFQRVCGYMRVDRRQIELHIFPDETDELRSILPYWRSNSGGCAGFYSHDPSGDSDMPKMNRECWSLLGAPNCGTRSRSSPPWRMSSAM